MNAGERQVALLRVELLLLRARLMLRSPDRNQRRAQALLRAAGRLLDTLGL